MEAIVSIDVQNFFILILLCLFSIFFYLLFFKKIKVDYNLPRSPPSLPIIGHLHHLLSLLAHKSFQKLSSKYGPLLYLRVFSVPIVLVSSPSIAYEIFGAQDVNVSTRNFPMHEGSLFFGSLGYVNAPYGEYWKSMKKLIVTKLLGPQALKRSLSVRAEELERFYLTLLDKAMKKESFEIAEEAMKLINNTICKMIMGRSCSEENGEAERVRGLVTKSDALAKKLFLAAILPKPLKAIGNSLFKKELMDVSSKFDEVLEEILLENKEKLEEHQQGTGMMDELLEAYGVESAEYKITRDHIKSFFVKYFLPYDLFIAGTDTSTHTIQWIMAEIVNNSYILERLREEIDSVVGKTRLIQETDLPNLPYLQATVKEGLRLHPPIPLVVRTFQERCKIGGFYVPEKTTLIVNGYAMMRDPEYWEYPQEFKPERFLASSRSSQKDEIRDELLKYIPFGSGRRGCPGANLAYVSVGTAIGVMVQCFDWKIKGDKINMNESAGKIALTMAHPLKCTLVPRTLIPLTSSM
ncbi:PREDICTED: cytochrome P450 705A5-like [Camelina sativa]|uniref:Cytochrome P450 705A5-like n=1 Tax=Camelina sativa TaxID=90675 RepID=A0ABM1R3E7_CAMSA|nr:PREDICTED: cytochrome P450 705A5-like [Camelina sativa]